LKIVLHSVFAQYKPVNGPPIASQQ